MSPTSPGGKARARRERLRCTSDTHCGRFGFRGAAIRAFLYLSSVTVFSRGVSLIARTRLRLCSLAEVLYTIISQRKAKGQTSDLRASKGTDRSIKLKPYINVKPYRSPVPRSSHTRHARGARRDDLEARTYPIKIFKSIRPKPFSINAKRVPTSLSPTARNSYRPDLEHRRNA